MIQDTGKQASGFNNVVNSIYTLVVNVGMLRVLLMWVYVDGNVDALILTVIESQVTLGTHKQLLSIYTTLH